MRLLVAAAPLFLAASTLAQGPPEGIAPSSAPPSGCELNASGNFTIGTLKVGHKKRESAMEAADGALVCTLKDGILRDRDARTGSVVANRQFQFDGPPQAGALYTGGFSICTNGSLAIGGSTRWWQCSSGGFYNLYDEWIGAQCEEIRIQVTFPPKPTPSVASSSVVVVASSSSVPVASVQSSLVTITGQVSTVSKSAVGPSASFTGMPNASVIATGSVSQTLSGSATLSVSRPASSATGAADAPPAGGAASTSFGVARGSMFAAFVVIFGAALVL
ncbi:hypothetical protein CC86DRAFT_406970 [Ophiobolus disseminans]|uniref:Cell wall mannoprotein PIR1-like C-terminal domain-containing protein n=1 Tax=Ophiobolus disseminans TaxID=1469910 RepID=A0A6A6ZYD2_9PLEO|nr:hypothetical protein CC86DRAFT_406970 [Ophiobolus disseminans]